MIFSRIANREPACIATCPKLQHRCRRVRSIAGRLRIKRNARGFTLVELLVVICIIGIVSAVGSAAFVSTQKSGRDSRRQADLGQLKNALEMYYGRHHEYPLTLDGLVTNDEGVLYIKGIPQDPSSPAQEYGYLMENFGECFTLWAMSEIHVGEWYRVVCP